MGHVVVIVGFDPAKGFKIKNSAKGKTEWIPVNRMTLFQNLCISERYKAIGFRLDGNDRNARNFRSNRAEVVRRIKNAHKQKTGLNLSDFADPGMEPVLNDFGFVLKFKKDKNHSRQKCEIV